MSTHTIHSQKISDPSHGWYNVSVADFERVKGHDVLKGYSYISPNGQQLWLEEDSEFPEFKKKAEALGFLFSFAEPLYRDSPSVIREFARALA